MLCWDPIQLLIGNDNIEREKELLNHLKFVGSF
jgi:hypothetical protein